MFFLSFFLTQTAASVGKRTKLNAAFSSVFVRPFLTEARQRKSLGKKADGLSLWLHMNLQKYVAAVVKERSVIFHPLYDKQNIEREDKRY